MIFGFADYAVMLCYVQFYMGSNVRVAAKRRNNLYNL